MQEREARGVKRKREAVVEDGMAKGVNGVGDSILVERTIKMLDDKHLLLTKYLHDGTLALNQNFLLTKGTELVAMAEMLSQKGVHSVEVFQLTVETMSIAAMFN